jgi:hypothetical protein
MRQTVTSIAAILALVAGAAVAIPPDSLVLRDSDITYMVGKGMLSDVGAQWELPGACGARNRGHSVSFSVRPRFFDAAP